MADYSDDIATALELIAEYGQKCDWHKDSITFDDPDKPWKGGSNNPSVYQPFICFVPADGTMFGMSKYAQAIERGVFTTFGLMAPTGFEPDLSDKLVRSGKTQVVFAIDVIQPAEQPVLYILSIK